MYGQDLEEIIPKIPNDKSMIIVVGGTKVPGEVYGLSDYNISIGNQPHSEVAALAIFLNTWVGRIDSSEKFNGGEIKVIPSIRGKKVFIAEEE
jgi:tRNA (cytidine56-2'-O)-methyltransferase